MDLGGGKNRFHRFFFLSLSIHGLLFAALVYLIVKDPFYWGGGLSGSPSVVMVELSDWRGEEEVVEEKEGEETEEKQPPMLLESKKAEISIPFPPEKKPAKKESEKKLFPGGEETAMHKPGFGEGDSPTPAGGKGSGFDAVTGQNKSPDILALIRQKIMQAKSYPLAARRRGIEGTVKIRFRIAKDGNLEQVAVVLSSGSDLLDQEAVATVKRALPYPYYEGDILMGLKFDLRE
ncbi:MAG: energy transducer TonB [Deltaproteobacteria bacterium]|nr:energy transducer TonB [Deltaproteobacteria bacterium]